MSDDPVREPKIGEILFGTYTVEQFIGCGASSKVYRVRDTATGEPYALKYPTTGVSAFLEREVLRQMVLPWHRNVVPVVAVELDRREQPFLFLEYMDAGTLRDRLHGSPWAREMALPVLRDIAEGMAHANRSGEVAHLDLKPENILFTSADTAARVADFGLLRKIRVERVRYPSVAATTGTLGYQAPEVVLATGNVSQSCDVYSFGLIALEMLTGSLPGDQGVDQAQFYRSPAGRSFFLDFSFGDHPLASHVPDEDVRSFLASCLAYEPDQRIQTFWAVLEAIGRLGVPAQTEPERPPASGEDRAARRALSRAHVLWREGDEDGALNAVNTAVLFSGTDAPTRAEALGLGADVLDDRGLTEHAQALRSLSVGTDAFPHLALDAVPNAPRAEVFPSTGYVTRFSGVDPWALREGPLPGHESERERDKEVTAVQAECKKGRFHSALDIVRYVLPRNHVLGLKLASLVFWTSREDLLKAPEPPTELDYEDPRFDPIRVECGRCRSLSWLAFGATVLAGTSPGGNIGSTAFAQCVNCALTLCGPCRTAAGANKPLSHGLDTYACPDCRRRMTWAKATGRTRPWGHVMPETPVSTAFLVRSGPVPVMEDDWLRTALLGASPDLLINEIPVHCTHIVRARGGRELADIALLVSERHTGAGTNEHTEVVYGTDAEGVPFALAKVLQPPLRPVVWPPDQLSDAHRIDPPQSYYDSLIDDTTNPLSGAGFTIPIPVFEEPGRTSVGASQEEVDGYAQRLLTLLIEGERWESRLTREQQRLWLKGPHLEEVLRSGRPADEWIHSQVEIRRLGHELDRKGGKTLMREVAKLASALCQTPGALDVVARVWDGIGSWEA